MSQQPFTPDDPRLTAYVLGELEPSAAADLESALADSPALRRTVEELRATSAELFAALQTEPMPAGAVQLPSESRAEVIAGPDPTRSRRQGRFLLVNAVTLLLLVGVVIGLQGTPDSVSVTSRDEQLALAAIARTPGESKLELELQELQHHWMASDGALATLADRDGLSTTDGLTGNSNLSVAPSDPVTGRTDEYSSIRKRTDQPKADFDASRNEWMREGFRFSYRNADSPDIPAIREAIRYDAHQPPATAETTPLARFKTVPQRLSEASRAGGEYGKVTEGREGQPGSNESLRQLVSSPQTMPASPATDSSDALHLYKTTPQPYYPVQLPNQHRSSLSTYFFDLSADEPGAGEHRRPRIEAAQNALRNVELRSKLWGISAGQEPSEFGRKRGSVPLGLNRGLQELSEGELTQEQLARSERRSEFSSNFMDGYYAGHRFMLLDDDFGLDPTVDRDDVLQFDAIAANESYAPVVENDFTIPTGDDALSTFSLDVDTASYSNVRRFLTQQQLPPPDAVRIEELVNYFDYDLPQPEGDEPFSVMLEATSCPWEPRHRLVRIGLQGREIDMTQRPLTRLVFLLDVSGSMSDANKLPLLKESMKLLVNELGENDRIAIVTYSNSAELKLDSTAGSDRETILTAIDSLSASGSTNGAGGIQLAYETAAKQFLKDASNRVILCTDGDFNVGVSDDDELVQMIEQKRDSGVFLSIFGYGMGNLKDAKLEGLADKGNGHYGYIDDLDEARKVFVEELTGMLYTIAKDVKLQVEFNPAKVASYRLLGYENRTLSAEDFNNDAVDAGEMGAGHSVTALYEIVPAGPFSPPAAETTPSVDPLKYQPSAISKQQSEDEVQSPESTVRHDNSDSQPSTQLLTVKLRYKQPDGDENTKLEFPLDDEPKSCSSDLQFASAVTGFGLLLRNSRYAAGCNWDLVVELADGAKGDDPTGRRGEFIDLARQARRLWNAVHPEKPGYGRPPQMTSLETPPGILHIDNTTRRVWISLGMASGVRPQATFCVYGRTPEEKSINAADLKAKIEVLAVDRNASQCRILEENLQRPMAVGDAVVDLASLPQSGVITEVSGGQFVVISGGSRSGLMKHEVLQVIRIAGEQASEAQPAARVQYLGRLRLVEVETDSSIGQFAPADDQATIAIGDRVVSEL
ncbi:MAG: von Willebrand factor type A domain-containing protein [Planctomycetaceae bacterium]|nr:von Willebrand factor type A domain-containing protein [Planctomycetaceae bacterium]